jgi:hypothetical protein
VLTIRHCLLLAGVLCLSITGARAQGNIPSALVTNEDERAIAKHRLTVDNVRKLFAVDRELLTLMTDVPDLRTRAGELRTRIDPHNLETSLVLETKVLEGIPETAEILQRHRITAREYVVTKRVAIGAAMSDEALKGEALQRQENAAIAQFMTNSQALQFWRAMDPALKAEAAEWKKVCEALAGHGGSR